MQVNIKETVVKEEDITEEELMKQDPLEVAGSPVKKETSEDDEQIFVKKEIKDEGYDLKSDINVV